MKYPNLREEKQLWASGYHLVAGLDEAGRGPLAGPVVAAAIVINPEYSTEIFKKNLGIRDSKKLSEQQREKFFTLLTGHPKIHWGVGVISEKIIDAINIFEASKLAMQCALDALSVAPEFLLLDGNFKIYNSTRQKSIVQGDEKIFSCTAAGIIAKVTRDRIMHDLHKKYPNYGFDQHKGYATAFHVERIKQFGPSEIHRKSFWPVSE